MFLSNGLIGRPQGWGDTEQEVHTKGTLWVEGTIFPPELYPGKHTKSIVEQLKETLTEKAKSSARGIRKATNLLFYRRWSGCRRGEKLLGSPFLFRTNSGVSLRSPFVYIAIGGCHDTAQKG